MPDRHALLGPSSAHRWLACPPSARLTEQYPDTAGAAAATGTLAHRLGELLLREHFEETDIAEGLERVRQSDLYTATMEETMEGYRDFIVSLYNEAISRDCLSAPTVFVEAEFEYSDYAPEGFGTSDCTIIADGLMDVVDYKNGFHAVSAKRNPQMMLYALGAYTNFGVLYDVDTVRMTIYQPNAGNVDSDTISVKALLRWGHEELIPKAKLAWEGAGVFQPDEETCRWCGVKAICRARKEYQLQLAREEFSDPPTLSPEEIADVLKRLSDLKAWAKAVEEYALDQALNHQVQFPGFKLVEGISKRKYGNQEALAETLLKAGYEAAQIYQLVGLTAMEKLVGKKKLDELAGDYIIKPEGKPTLKPDSDKRPALHSIEKAAEDFSDE